ncbi:MAG: hypothetical protein VYE22_37505 [Myxococcota bacterium]|nr:hypothetical protein [Myxococcota bacterium]
MERWLGALLAAALTFGSATLAAAQDEAEDRQHLPLADQGAQERARLHFQAGASYYEAGSYEDALREWRHAYELSQRPELLYNLSLAYQGMGDLENAVSHLERYLEEVHDIPNRANLELRVRNFRQRLEAEAAEAEAEAEAEVVESEATLEAEAEAQVEPEPELTPAGGSGPNVGAIAGFSVAAAGVVMVAIFGSLTLVEDGNLDAECGGGCDASAVSDLQTFALLTDIGFGVALAGAAVGALLLLVGGDDGAESQSASLQPWVGRDSGGAVLRGTF